MPGASRSTARNHLRRIRAPAPASAEVVLDLARTAAMAGFDRARPLWEYTLVTDAVAIPDTAVFTKSLEAGVDEIVALG
jgi:diacylglycerol O-acyltransferase / wax synthase